MVHRHMNRVIGRKMNSIRIFSDTNEGLVGVGMFPVVWIFCNDDYIV